MKKDLLKAVLIAIALSQILIGALFLFAEVECGAKTVVGDIIGYRHCTAKIKLPW
jgi:hypothetical protein